MGGSAGRIAGASSHPRLETEVRFQATAEKFEVEARSHALSRRAFHSSLKKCGRQLNWTLSTKSALYLTLIIK